MANPAFQPPPYSVQGRSAIVTGAGSGINYCFASLLLSKGCNVLIADLALRPEAEELLKTYDGSASCEPKAFFLRTDVTSWPQLSQMFTVATEKFGSVDIVCPGAGVFEPHFSNFWHPPGSAESRDDIDGGRYATVDINITHPIRTTQLAISHFLNPPSGVEKVSLKNPKRVLIISSIAGQVSSFATPVYIATKHAMHGFLRSLALLEETIGVRVNGVAPGIIKTPLWTEHPEKLKFLDAETDEWATPEEVAEGMLRLLEDESLPGGKILEVGARQTRLVEPFNDPGPSGPGHTVSNTHEAAEVFDWLGQDGWGAVPSKSSKI